MRVSRVLTTGCLALCASPARADTVGSVDVEWIGNASAGAAVLSTAYVGTQPAAAQAGAQVGGHLWLHGTWREYARVGAHAVNRGGTGDALAFVTVAGTTVSSKTLAAQNETASVDLVSQQTWQLPKAWGFYLVGSVVVGTWIEASGTVDATLGLRLAPAGAGVIADKARVVATGTGGATALLCFDCTVTSTFTLAFHDATASVDCSAGFTGRQGAASVAFAAARVHAALTASDGSASSSAVLVDATIPGHTEVLLGP